MLTISDLNVYYGGIHALKGISLKVEKGQTVTLIGSNGAGKSTTLKAISGLIGASSGSINFDGIELTNLSSNKVVSQGLIQVPEGRHIFTSLNVEENLKMGAYIRKNKKEIQNDLEYVYSLFPRLKERSKQLGGTLSGGEQQMLAIGRAIMSKPKLLMLDEP
ncbi:MAG: ABC transporter ATP-binding protein, partial [Clostridium sp.]